MRWSLPLGRLGGTEARAELAIVPAALLTLTWSPAGVRPASEVADPAAFVLALAAVAIVSLGRAIAQLMMARSLGLEVRALRLTPWGSALGLGPAVRDEALPASARPGFGLASHASIGSWHRARPAAWRDALTRLAGPVGAAAVGAGALAFETLAPSVGPDVHRLAWLGLGFGVLSLSPAFPLDGGAALQAALTPALGRVAATRWVARLGRLAAGLVLALGFVEGSAFFGVLGLALVLSAGAEERTVVIRDIIAKRVARDVMQPIRHSFGAGTSVAEAAGIMVADGASRAYAVTFGDRVLGVLHREPVLRALALGGPAPLLADLIDRNVVTTGPDTPLVDVLAAMDRVHSSTAIVVSGERPRGIVLIDTVAESVQAARRDWTG